MNAMATAAQRRFAATLLAVIASRRVVATASIMRSGAATLLAAFVSAQDFDTPAFLYDQQRFHEQLEGSRWSANQMDYVDGASSAVLRNPYTLAFDPYDESLFVASFTLNHIVRLRLREKRKAQYKVCLLFTSPSPRDGLLSRMPSSA